jgi:UDP:flavonoid glycosyltransferase YjiC (YdhE family)
VLGDLPDPALFVNLCPPSLRPLDAPAAQSMRWVPRVRQRRLESWMYTRTEGRRRVLVTAGTRNLTLDTPGTSLQDLVKQLTAGGAEVLIAALPETAAKYAAELGDARIGWIPLDVVAPSCDLAVHHGGATTAATLLNSGVPQLVLPDNGYGRAVGEAMARFGAAVVLEPRGLARGQESHHAISKACLETLSTEHFGTRAMDLASEIASLPTADAVVDQIEEHIS